MKARWPVYQDGPLTGPGCGQTNHTDDCLCDVVIPHGPARPSVKNAGRMMYESTAELALKRRGISHPTPLDLMRQVVALSDALGPIRDEVRGAADLAAAVPQVDPFNRQWTGQAAERANPYAARRMALRDLIATTPRYAHELMGMTKTQMLMDAYGLSKASVGRLETLALGFDAYAPFAAQAALENIKLDKGIHPPLFRCLKDMPSHRRVSRLTDEDRIALAKSLVEDGDTCAQVARLLNVNESTVYRWVNGQRRNGENLRGPSQVLSREQWEALRNDYLAGKLTVREIGSKYGVGRSAVAKYTDDLPRRRTIRLVAA